MSWIRRNCNGQGVDRPADEFVEEPRVGQVFCARTILLIEYAA
jgi:hypothetical protein